MAIPSPTWNGSGWTVDLREPWKLGRHRLATSEGPPVGTAAAIHEAYAVLERLRAAAPPSPQLGLNLSGGRILADALREYREARAYRSRGGRRWVYATSDLVIGELGATPLAEFSSADGARLLAAWRDRVRAKPDDLGRKVGPKAMRDRILVLTKCLKWCCQPSVGYLASLPLFPTPKIIGEEDVLFYVPLTRWIDERHFRTVRDAIYRDASLRQLEAAWQRWGLPYPECTGAEDYVSRRRLYLSRAYYTGERREDLDHADDASVAVEFGVYYRRSHKTRAPETAEAICGPFLRDLEFERGRLGRPWRAGEAICGGPWKGVTSVIAAAAARVGLPAFNLRDCRRSFVYHKALAGVAEERLVRLMGHVDSEMVRRIYLQIPPRSVRDEAGAAWPQAPGGGATASAVVLPMRQAPGAAAPGARSKGKGPNVASGLPETAIRAGLSVRNIKRGDGPSR